MFQTVLSSFLLVSASEMGDKTQLLAFSLAARFRKPWPIMTGIFIATLLNHALASALGEWVGAKISPNALNITLGILFISFGIWTLKPDTLDEKETKNPHGPFLTTVILFFIAEMGDKTQFATLALAARFHSVVFVTIGTTLGMMVSDGLAVFLGDRMAGKIQMKNMHRFAAVLFFIFGFFSFYKAFYS